MKNKIALITLATLLLGICSFVKLRFSEIGMKEAFKGSHLNTLHSSGAPTGKTGAPGETNCTACHSGTVNDGTTMNTLSLFEEGTSNLVTEYEMGVTYDAVLNVGGTSARKGFQTTARATSSNLTSGSLTAVSNSTALVTSGSKEYINHVSASLGSSNFSFKWTAPSVDEGEVRFYVAANVSNANNNNQGDQIYLSQHSFSRKLFLPVASFVSDLTTICPSNSISFTSTSSGNPSSYNWSFPGGNPSTSTDPNPIINYPVSGTFDVSLTVTNADGSNQVTQSGFINVLSPTSITIGTTTNPTGCGVSDGGIELTGSGSGTVSWTGASSGNTSSVTLPFLISSLVSGNYTISFVNAAGCASSSLNQSLSDPSGPAAPSISSSDPDNTICTGESITLTSSVTTGNVWSTGETTNSINVTSSGNYSVLVNSSGCNSVSSPTITVIVNPIPATPVITSSDTDNIICSGTESLILSSSPASSYLWSTGELTQQITVADSGIFTVTVNEAGCNSLPSAALAVVAQTCASLSDNQLDLILIYPNPTSNQLLIKGSDLVKFNMLHCVDNSGRIIANWKIDQIPEMQVDLSQIKAGNYRFILDAKDGSRIEKAVQIL